MSNSHVHSLRDVSFPDNRIEAMKYLVSEMDKLNEQIGTSKCKFITGILSQDGVIFATHQIQNIQL